MSQENMCRIYAEMHLVFDNDFDVNEINHVLETEPTACKCHWETKKVH